MAVRRPKYSSSRDKLPWQDSRLYRDRVRELAPEVRRSKRRLYAIHEAGHFLVAVYLGVIPESIGVDVGTLVQTGVVVTRRSHGRLSRAEEAMVLLAGGLAQQRIGVAAHSGSTSDHIQLRRLRLSQSTLAKARLTAASILETVWADVELLATLLVEEQPVIAGETAVAYLLARRSDSAGEERVTAPGLAAAYKRAVDHWDERERPEYAAAQSARRPRLQSAVIKSPS